jgi:hypothetical protein
VLNNPVRFTDPSGYGCTPEDGPYCTTVYAPAPSWDDELEGAPEIDFAELGSGMGVVIPGNFPQFGPRGPAFNPYPWNPNPAGIRYIGPKLTGTPLMKAIIAAFEAGYAVGDALNRYFDLGNNAGEAWYDILHGRGW